LKYVADVETELNDLPPVVCNIGEVNQVFLDLLVNAAHAIGDARKNKGSEEKGVIRVRTVAEEDAIVTFIAGTGCGIPGNIKSKVFDPFFTTKESGQRHRVGFGDCALVVDRHGGTLTFESQLGKGTTFYVRLPLGETNPAEQKAVLPCGFRVIGGGREL